MACAIPKNWSDPLQTVADTCKLQWKQIAPQSVAAFNRWKKLLPASAWLVMYQPGKLTIVITDEKKLVSAYRHVQCSAEEISEEKNFKTLLSREALRMNLPIPDNVCFPRILTELIWVLNVRSGKTTFRVLSNLIPDTVQMTPGIDLALSGV
jgi:hypothetical protein